MKKNYLNLLAAILLVTSFGFTSCDKADDDLSTIEHTEQETVFGMFFDRDSYNLRNNRNDIDVTFMTNDLSQIPEVEVNGVKMEDMDLMGSSMVGELKVQFSETMNYTISCDGKSLTGSIVMPDTLTNVKYNNQEIFSSYNSKNGFVLAPNYKFEWDNVVCDYQEIYYYLNSNSSNNIQIDKDVNTYTVTDTVQTDQYMDFRIYSKNGNAMRPGSVPNVTGDYGKGYVTAITRSEFELSEYYNKSAKNNENQDLALEEFKNAFNVIINKR